MEYILEKIIEEKAQIKARYEQDNTDYSIIDFSALSSENELVKKLIENKATITTAESCTGGMISSTLVNVPGASSVLNEAYVTYANEAKMRLLSVKKETLDKYGAVSEQTAYEMVEGVMKKAASTAAIAVTGIAGPDGGTKEKPVGTVYAGIKYRDKIRIIRYNFMGDRYNIRLKTTRCVISDLCKMME